MSGRAYPTKAEAPNGPVVASRKSAGGGDAESFKSCGAPRGVPSERVYVDELSYEPLVFMDMLAVTFATDK